MGCAELAGKGILPTGSTSMRGKVRARRPEAEDLSSSSHTHEA
jgi:hypothetical protein